MSGPRDRGSRVERQSIERAEVGRVPAVRVSDAERDVVVERLREHYAQGRLSLEEYADRSALALEARTADDLQVLSQDLPEPAFGAPLPADRDNRIPSSRWTIAIFSFVGRRGPWRLGRRTIAFSLFGKSHVDFRGATLPPGLDDIVVWSISIFGATELVVPEGVPLEMSGLAIFGKNDSAHGGPPIPDVPAVRVRAFSLFGAVIRFTGRERAFRRRERKESRAREP